MERLNLIPVVIAMAKQSVAHQERRPKDYTDEDGILVCGNCGQRRQAFREFQNPTAENPDAVELIKVAIPCQCDKNAEADELRRKRGQEKRERIGRLREASLMDERFRAARFDAFQVTKGNERNRKLCLRYVDAFDEMLEKNQGLIFWGGVGTGKSFAAACIANALLDKGVPVIMTSFVRILEALQADSGAEEGILSRIERAKLVIFDDLGAERSTDYALEKVYNVVDSRYRSGLPMIVTTNVTLAEMKQEMDLRYSRIYDRLFETCYPMQFTGVSWRKRSANQRFEEMEKLLNGD